ncbi:FAD-binding oxidoreductase [Salinisphaera sp. Q1T1-3]|uniref:FAD-binding oxidoreductase n=1 Tax=Salinisphaera sp. Q1T1-3 TaxID=2321229 RepID=UPI000E715B59|nr:FAD-binding oxidoreductase [Salinisphaera sp. Q1T1-3]RJS92353.1 FAD-binding oxidoreductase [Salinisphaera sp. Q1T1-3]
MTDAAYSSWGRLPGHEGPARVLRPAQRADARPEARDVSWLAYGCGRSYGDVPRNDGGGLIDTAALDRFIAFDAGTGVIECEPGVQLGDILRLGVPAGWFLPVTPGTQFVTIAGALANDVHGKNHHVAGTFGAHVAAFDLWRSDVGEIHCRADNAHRDLFAATIGGLGLTGLITRVQLRLKRIPGPFMDVETIRFETLADFFALSANSADSHEYTVAWVDCSARGNRLGRGWFMRANHLSGLAQPRQRPRGPGPSVFATPPFSLVNRATLGPLNSLYFHRRARRRDRAASHYQPYFYPLDAVRHWNRVYGPRGFYQYQCVVPPGDAPAVIAELLERIAAAGQGSFLSVLKIFGDIPSPGLLSFPRPGATLALDFPNRGAETTQLLDALDSVVRAADGAVYPAKDARMAPEAFRQFFPRWPQFADQIDPAFSSTFWRRIAGEHA